MISLKCPKCQTHNDFLEGEPLVCAVCGFYGDKPRGARPAGKPVDSGRREAWPQEDIDDVSPPDDSIWVDREDVYTGPYQGPPRKGCPPGVGGRQRSFGVSLLLCIVTFGIYSLVWHFKVFRDLDVQHKKEHGALWFVLGIFIGVFQIVYIVLEMKNLHQIRGARGMDRGCSHAFFWLWLIFGSIIIVGPFIAYYRLNRAINDTWDAVYHQAGINTPN